MIERLDFELCDPLHNISKEGIICHHIYLPRMEDICYPKDDNIYKDYAILLCESYEEMENLAGSDSGRCALIKMLKSLGRDDKFMTVIDKYEYEKILHIEEGIGQTKREMVISMKENGIEVEKIAKIANITIEEVNKILEEEKK